MVMIKGWLVSLGLWIARRGGYRHIPMISQGLIDSARMFVTQVEAGFAEQSGEFKRSQALRAMLNRHGGASERECALAIELAVRDGT